MDCEACTDPGEQVEVCHHASVSDIKRASALIPRLKELREEPYTQAEAERAAGMGSYIPPKKVEVQTQQVVEDMDWTQITPSPSSHTLSLTQCLSLLPSLTLSI